jgi:hypothetical protein
MTNTRRLILPGGGTFDLPMPVGTGTYKGVSGAVVDSAECPSVLVPVLIGSGLGGLLTWLLVKLSR